MVNRLHLHLESHLQQIWPSVPHSKLRAKRAKDLATFGLELDFKIRLCILDDVLLMSILSRAYRFSALVLSIFMCLA